MDCGNFWLIFECICTDPFGQGGQPIFTNHLIVNHDTLGNDLGRIVHRAMQRAIKISANTSGVKFLVFPHARLFLLAGVHLKAVVRHWHFFCAKSATTY